MLCEISYRHAEAPFEAGFADVVIRFR